MLAKRAKQNTKKRERERNVENEKEFGKSPEDTLAGANCEIRSASNLKAARAASRCPTTKLLSKIVEKLGEEKVLIVSQLRRTTTGAATGCLCAVFLLPHCRTFVLMGSSLPALCPLRANLLLLSSLFAGVSRHSAPIRTKVAAAAR